jgi:hypothetical protein
MNMRAMSSFARLCATCLIIAVPLETARADECKDQYGLERCHASFSVFLDNDSLQLDQLHDEDRNYTMGLAFLWSGRWIEERGLTKPLDAVNSLLPDRLFEHEGPSSSFHTLRFGNVAYTPDRLNTKRPIPNDRPYASLLALDVATQQVYRGEQHALTTEFSFGLLGLSISERFQRWLHKKIQDSPDEPPFPPQGWGNQISDGGEPTIRYTVRWQRELLPVNLKRHVDLQLIAEANAGYHTNVGTGAAFRAGLIRSPWWQFTIMPIPAAAAVAGDGSGPGCSDPGNGRFELYGWTGVMGRAWGYNALLQGQFRDSAVTVPADRVERFVYDYAAGLTSGVCIGHHWHRLNVSYSRRSPEFDGPLRRYHSWGGIYYSIAFQP